MEEKMEEGTIGCWKVPLGLETIDRLGESIVKGIGLVDAWVDFEMMLGSVVMTPCVSFRRTSLRVHLPSLESIKMIEILLRRRGRNDEGLNDKISTRSQETRRLNLSDI